ncbi:nitronate monooxygenase [Actinomadura craniellae]|uniref:Propionate 3-nitronate monooxygenase n=1 Tax=Actinomadura craniellae TaxID=2231787 RepID=A0A365GVQ4_9ACTN|nr:nitronate monooxygenase [Actinomadura craniellae]RAY10854.1 nitronate monooxygenase [Actinomadura craniellae]
MADLRDLLRRPVVAAPMAGGASGPDLVAAVAEAGGLGFLAAGYKTAEDVRAEIGRARRATPAFGVNVFVPPPQDTPVDAAAVAAYRDRLTPEADRLGVALGEPVGGDDGWDAKLAVLLADPVPVVSFTFGLPSREVIDALRERGSLVVATVTSPAEARLASAVADALCVQGAEAGAHRGSFVDDDSPASPALPLRELLPAVRRVTDLPLIAAGGLATAADVAGVLAAGAVAAQLGTAFLRAPESGTPAPHRAALADPRFTATAVTRAFSGRSARGLVNRFMSEHGPHAPAAYPHVHQITTPLRRAAAARNDPDTMALWAGTGFRQATADPAGEIVARLAP